MVEQGLLELGLAIGASSSRPEKEARRGPDDLWLFDDVGFCVEAKSEKAAPISKTDAAQLMLSHRWCGGHVDLAFDKIYPVVATAVAVAGRHEDISFGPRLMAEEMVFDLIDRLRSLVVGLSFEGPLFSDHVLVGKKLAGYGLTGKQILGRLPVLNPQS